MYLFRKQLMHICMLKCGAAKQKGCARRAVSGELCMLWEEVYKQTVKGTNIFIFARCPTLKENTTGHQN